MADRLMVTGTVRASQAGLPVAGHSVRIELRSKVDIGDEVVTVAAGGSGRVGEDGSFTVAVELPGDPLGPVTVTVSAPTGAEVHRSEVSLESLAKPLRLRVTTAAPVDIEASEDPALGARLRIDGLVIDARGRDVPAGLPVVIWGLTVGGDGQSVEHPVVVTTTAASGHFTAPWTDVILAAAVGRVDGGPPVPVHLDPVPDIEGGRLPLSILLVVDLDETVTHPTDDGSCSCEAVPPRAPDQRDLTSNPAAFSQDLGGGCVDLTMPNRTLEEFAYLFAVRTSEPRVTGLTLRNRVTVPPQLLVDLLGVSIASQAVGMIKATTVQFQSDELTLDVHSARALVRSDRPPALDEIARAAWLSEVGHTKELIGAGLRTVAARSPLDADHQIDWDDSPQVYLSIDIAHGHLLQYREVWRADGYSLGDLLYSLPLAPGQRRQIAVVDWDRRSTSAREDRLEFEEHLDALLTRDRDVSELVGTDLHEEVSAGSRNTTWGAAGGLGAGFIGSGFGIFGGIAGGASGSSSRSWQDAARTFSADSMQQLRDRVSQRSSSLRSQRSSVIQTVSQGETVRAETEVVANYNRCHAITIEYFEVLRHFLITHELASVRECLFVPFQILAFDRAKALRWREVLEQFLRKRELARGFDAIERIADNWVGWDYPVARYSEEAPESIEGELRISFLLPRPRDGEDGRFQIDMWRGLAPFLNVDPLELFTARMNDRNARERDRVFRDEIAPGIAANLVNRLRLAFVGPDGGETEVPIDATLVSRYAEATPLYVTINVAGGIPSVPRDSITHVKIWYDGPPLPPDAQVVARSGRLRYRTAHLTAMLFDDARIIDDIKEGDPVVVATPLSQRELRNPRQEDVELADRLVDHLNDHLEFYHQALWMSLDAQRRFMLLDSIEVPGQGGRSVASVCSNELVGIVGNSLVLPVAPGQRLDPTLAEPGTDEAPVPLEHAYAAPPSPPLRVSVPTRGVYAEAVAGDCDACEPIDDNRYWRWTTDGQLELPEILPVSTASRASEEPDLTPPSLPAPLVTIQNAPAVPAPAGLGGAFALLATPGLFQDITGLEGTQRNAGAAFEASLAAASALGDEAAKLASQQELSRNAGKMIDRIDQAQRDGLLSPTAAQELASSALKGLIGEPRAGGPSPTADPAVDKVIDQAAQTNKADIKVSNPSGTVEVSFDDDRNVIGSGLIASAPDETRNAMAQVPVLVELRESGDMTPWVLDTYDLVQALRGGQHLVELERVGWFVRDPRNRNQFKIRRRLRIMFPTTSAAPNVVAGTGRLPVVVLQHGNHDPNRDNHAGYDYLQRELAQRGIVSVSVDGNVPIVFGSHVEMRAAVVLSALDEMRELDGDPSSPYHGRLNLDCVGLMGHSRGGDAVVRAAKMNRGRAPARQFGIRAVCALAPTDFNHTLPPSPVPLASRHTDFFAVVYGALDGDVAGWGGARDFTGTGFRHYDRALCNKAMVFIDGCNHNRFNSVWFADGDDAGMDPVDVAAGGRLLSEADHQRLAIDYIGGLFRWQLLGENAERSKFDGTGANTAGANVSLQWSIGSRIEVIDNMEDPLKPRNLNQAFIRPFPDVLIGARALAEETNHITTVLGVEPPNASQEAYRVQLQGRQRDWDSIDALTFRVCAEFDLSDENTIAAGQLPEFMLVITDALGATCTIASTALPAPAPRRPVFHRAIDDTGNPENCSVLRLETMVVPRSMVTGVDPKQIDMLSVVTAPTMTSHLFFDSLQLVTN